MHFGSRESFRYFQCRECESLQILEIPTDLERHYPTGYYSFASQPARTGPGGTLRTIRTRYQLTGRGALGRILSAVTRYPFASVAASVRELRLPRTTRILDVGCGDGRFLRDLALAGFRTLHGADPFIPREIEHPDGVHIFKRPLDEMEGSYDLILFNHSFEHLPVPRRSLEAAARLLATGGHCVIHAPTVPCFAWEHYGTDWVQLDAPRHLLIPSPAAMRRMAAAAGLTLSSVTYDSTALQFIGSEQYRQDRPLHPMPRVSRHTLRELRKDAARLNREGRGDQAAFLLTRTPTPATAARTESAGLPARRP